MPYSPLDAPNRTHFFAHLIVDELVRSGVDTFFVAPGSRSTPLTTAVAQHPRARPVVHVDERGTAFAALGYGRATGCPAAWITTSGTAVANGMPAVVEAATDGVPMLCLTADRPPELRGSGANQTIDQVKIFGDYARHFVDLPPPSSGMPPEALLCVVDEAVHRARRVPPGPVHLNCMFRKPLDPVPSGEGPFDPPALNRWVGSNAPYTTRPVPAPQVPDADVEALAERLAAERRGLVVAGRLDTDADRDAVRALAQRLGWPLVADVTSGLRLGPVGEAVRAVHVHALLKSDRFRADHAPDAVLHLGGRTLSKQLRLFLRETRPQTFAVVRPDPSRIDPDHVVTHHVESDVAAFGAALLDRLPKEPPASPSWTESWRQASAAAGAAIREGIDAVSDETGMLVEPAVAHLVARDVPPDHALVLASSMPVRDVQRYAPGAGEAVPVFANRGASGIDGTFATAAGVAIGRDAPATLLIGDLASLHDLSSLALLRHAPVVAVVVNNEGGGIFHFLPIAEHDEVFEDFFATPHPASFSSAAGVYDLAYHRAATAAELSEAYAETCRSGASALIEVRTDRHENPGVHDRLDEAAAGAF